MVLMTVSVVTVKVGEGFGAGQTNQPALSSTRFLLGLRAMKQQGLEITPTASTQEMTPIRVVGLMLRRSTDLTPEEKATLKQIGQLHPHIEYLNTSLQHFLSMVRHLRGDELEQWVQNALQSNIPEMIAFAKKLRQDQAAVQVGLTLPWDNGVVEGNVNRLKLLKRSMYGRANFDLLRLRVLHHRKCGSTSFIWRLPISVTDRPFSQKSQSIAWLRSAAISSLGLLSV
jgi:hypothetical protein